MSEKFFSLIGRLRYIDRWSLMRNTRKENVAEHSFMAAILTHALCAIENELFGGDLDPCYAAVLALYHESAEVFTGDLPTPVKYHSDEIRKAYKAIEEKAERKLMGFLPEDTAGVFLPFVSPDKDCAEYAFVKYADKLAALIKCVEECAAGNSEFAAAKASAEAALRAESAESVRYVLEHFVDAFGLSLDESI